MMQNTQGGGNLWTDPNTPDLLGPNADRAAQLREIISQYAITPQNPRTGERIPFGQLPELYDPTLEGEDFDRQWEARRAGWFPGADGAWRPQADMTAADWAAMPKQVGGADGIVYRVNPDGTLVKAGI